MTTKKTPADARTKFTKKAAATIARAMKLGCYAEQAAALAGIDRRTLARWLASGRAGREPYAEFLRSFECASAASEQVYVAVIGKAAAAGQWQAAAWILERRHARRWGLQIRVTVEAEQVEFLERLRARLTPAEFDRVIRAATDDDAEPLALSSTSTLGGASDAHPSTPVHRGVSR